MDQQVAAPDPEPVAPAQPDPAVSAVAEGTDAPILHAVPPPEPDRDARSGDDVRLRALTVAEAALVVGRHESTLRRYLKAERFPNAHRGSDDTWRIPVVDLVVEGLLPRSSEADQPGIVTELEAELERRMRENAQLRRRLAAAEALADERAERIRELGLSLRALWRGGPPEAETTRVPDPRPLVWSGEIALKDG
jgi:hypothetical protein